MGKIRKSPIIPYLFTEFLQSCASSQHIAALCQGPGCLLQRYRSFVFTQPKYELMVFIDVYERILHHEFLLAMRAGQPEYISADASVSQIGI